MDRCRGFLFIVRTIEILDIVVCLIEVEMQITSTVGTNQQTGKAAHITILSLALADIFPLLLHSVPRSPVNDGLMDAFENHPVFRIVVDAFLELVGLGIGFEVDDIAAILRFSRILPTVAVL